MGDHYDTARLQNFERASRVTRNIRSAHSIPASVRKLQKIPVFDLSRRAGRQSFAPTDALRVVLIWVINAIFNTAEDMEDHSIRAVTCIGVGGR
jgi:hypothetical protein